MQRFVGLAKRESCMVGLQAFRLTKYMGSMAVCGRESRRIAPIKNELGNSQMGWGINLTISLRF